MKNINKMTAFDRQWKDAFKQAEMSPPEGVWDKIDAELSKEEAGFFKRRAFIYKLLAAASIAFALGIGAFSVNYLLNDGTGQEVVQEQQNYQNLMNNDETSSSDDQDLIAQGDTQHENAGEGHIESLNQSVDGTVSQEVVSSQQVKLAHNDQNEFEQFNNSSAQVLFIETIEESELVSPKFTAMEDKDFITLSELKSHGIQAVFDDDLVYSIDHMYLIPVIPAGTYKKQKKEPMEGTFLAGLDFSTGLFDPNFQQGNNVFASTGGATFADARVESINDQYASFNTTNKDLLVVRSAGMENKPEVSYCYGANFGFKVSRRILLQTGVAYRKSNSTITTTGYFEDANSATQIPIVAAHNYQMEGLSAVKKVPETDLKSQYEFASIPLRAGYIALDRKVNITLLAGISSELFLNNQIGGNENFETLSNSKGDGSPYKSVYFNGSLGTMFGYTFAKNYLITVEPSYRFAVNSFTQEDFYLNSYPSSFMLSFGVAYNFK